MHSPFKASLASLVTVCLVQVVIKHLHCCGRFRTADRVCNAACRHASLGKSDFAEVYALSKQVCLS